MGISRFDQPAQQNIINSYVELPYAQLQGVLHQRQHQYDIGEAQAHENEDSFLKTATLEKDRSLRDKIISNYKDEAKAKYDSAKGDYSQLGSYAKEQAQKIKSDLAYGQLGAIHNNALSAHEYQKGEHARFIKGDITEEQYKRALDHSHENYQGVGDKIDGKYNSFNGYESANYQNLGEKALKIVDSWKADGTVSSPRSDGKVYLSNKHEWVDKNEVYNSAYQSLKSDKMNQSFVNEEKMFSSKGLDFNKLDHFEANKGIRQLQKRGLIDSTINPNELSAKEKYSILKEHQIYNDAVEPAANKASYNKYDNHWTNDPLYLHNLKKQEENDISGVGNSYTEKIQNINHKDLLPGVKADNNGRLTTTGYKKVVGGKEVNISEKEYKDQYNTLIDKYKLKSGENAQSAGAGTSGEGDQAWKKFNDTYKKVDNEKVSAIHLYDTNQEFRKLTLDQAKLDHQKYQEHKEDSDSKDYPNPYDSNGKLGSSYIDKFLSNYKSTTDNNKEIPLKQINYDSEQMNNNGSLTLANLQSGTFKPADLNARALVDQKGGDLDYSQLTKDGWQPIKVVNSGRVYSSGDPNSKLQERSIITLKNGDKTKQVTVFSRTNHEGMQNSREAEIANDISRVMQSKHSGDVTLTNNLVAKIKVDYTHGGAKLEYTHKDGTPASDKYLYENGYMDESGQLYFKTPEELEQHVQEELMKEAQLSGNGHVGKKTNQTRDFNPYTEE
jgi:hypothetical protein